MVRQVNNKLRGNLLSENADSSSKPNWLCRDVRHAGATSRRRSSLALKSGDEIVAGALKVRIEALQIAS